MDSDSRPIETKEKLETQIFPGPPADLVAHYWKLPTYHQLGKCTHPSD